LRKKLTPTTVIQYIHMHHAIWVTHRCCCHLKDVEDVVRNVQSNMLWIINPYIT